MPKSTKPFKKVRIRNPVATRAKLLQATIELVTEKGAAALSLKEAANRANVSRGVAYMHFDDREQLLKEAQAWISAELQRAVMRFDKGAPMRLRTFQTTKLVLEHPEASKLMINAAMSGEDLHHQHPLYKLIVSLLKQQKAGGLARPDIDIEIFTYIMFGSIAATVMLGSQHKGANVDKLSERFANEWNRILQDGIFIKRPGSERPSRPKRRTARASD